MHQYPFAATFAIWKSGRLMAINCRRRAFAQNPDFPARHSVLLQPRDGKYIRGPILYKPLPASSPACLAAYLA